MAAKSFALFTSVRTHLHPTPPLPPPTPHTPPTPPPPPPATPTPCFRVYVLNHWTCERGFKTEGEPVLTWCSLGYRTCNQHSADGRIAARAISTTGSAFPFPRKRRRLFVSKLNASHQKKPMKHGATQTYGQIITAVWLRK